MQTPSRCTWMRLVLWLIVLCGSGVCAGKRHTDADKDESGSESVSRARCVSRCLGLHNGAAPLTPLQCLEPCKHDWKVKKRSKCRELCKVFPKKQGECVASCEFLHSVLAVKQGSCPPPEGASGFTAACIESCDRDKECSKEKKCCFNGCGHTCQSPKDLFKGVPLKPKKDLRFEESPSGHLTVRWSSRSNISAEPVVYVLQRRWNFGVQPSEDTATPWEVETQTTELGASLSDTRPGRWYQFRVAAVNVHGTRGFTTPSKHIHSNRDPSSPPAPSALRVVDMNFGPGRLVAARIIWDIPTDLDIPIHHYKVSWSWTGTGHSSASPMSKRRKTVRENQVELSSMRSNRKYSVEVQGVSYWGQTELQGPQAVLHFITQRKAFRAAPQNPTGDLLDVGTPFYQDGQLRVHVYWQTSTDSSVEFYRLRWGPERCAHNLTKPMEKTRTRKNFVSLRGLLFSCKYKVLLQPVSSKSRRLAESSSFLTPSCAAIQAKSPKTIKCPEETDVPPEIIQMKAINLTASFQVHGDNVSASFRWDLAMSPSNQQLIGYQVTWVEVIPTKRHSRKLPHSLISQSQILPPEGNVLVVSGLHPASVYHLEVRVITAEGEGPATSRTFQTPGYQITPKQRFQLGNDRIIKPIPASH
ncbi:anosmin-1-like isoform 2-T2 [Anableps anableps]